MKKVLSLVLAVMMVVGMTTVAFAAAGDISADVDYTNDVAISGKVGDTGSFTIGLGAETVEGTYPQALTVSADVSGVFSALTAVATNSNTIKVSYTLGAARSATAVKFTIKGEDAGSNTVTETATVTIVAPTAAKKVPAGYKITGFVSGYDWKPDVEDLNRADMKSHLPLVAEMFTWEYKGEEVDLATAGIDGKATMTSSHLKDIGLRRSYQKGTANTIRDAKLRESDSDVRVRTVKFYVSTKETDVELKLALTYKGSTKNAPEYTYDFTIENVKELIEEDQFEVYSNGNIYLEADATVRNVEFQGDDDENVFATKTVVKGQKYYFNVTDELESEDEKMIADNPEIDSIYNVYAVNMANATVQFKNLDREFFVYDTEGKLLGTTKDSKLPLARKYVLTTAKVDFGGADEEPVEEPTVEEPADVDAPPMGGGEVPPSNNYNPNTGL